MHAVVHGFLFQAVGAAGFHGHRDNAFVHRGGAQHAVAGWAVQHGHAAEMLGERHHGGLVQVGAQLRLVDALLRSGVQIHQVIALAHDVIKQRKRQAAGGAAVLVAGEIAVQIAPVAEIAGAIAEAVQVDDWHAHHGAGEFIGFQLVHQAPHHLDAVEFVAVHGGGQAQARARFVAVGYQHRHRRGDRAERLIRRPVQGREGARLHGLAEQLQRFDGVRGRVSLAGRRCRLPRCVAAVGGGCLCDGLVFAFIGRHGAGQGQQHQGNQRNNTRHGSFLLGPFHDSRWASSSQRA